MTAKNRYPRNMLGYGRTPPVANWPDNAAICLQFVINYEEGGENCILHGDEASEAFLSEIVGARPWPGQRHWNMESIYEYGSRAGFWRLHRLFTDLNIPVTVYGVASALQRAPEQVAAMLDADWEIASHGYKWIDYKDHRREEELADIRQAIEIHTAVTGSRPRGWYTGRCSENTVDLITEEGGFDYISDSYADDLPYWREHSGHNQLIIPYTLDSNDMRFAALQGFNSGDQFFSYLKDSFDVLYLEGERGAPKMLNIGLHCRLVGRPGRLSSLRRFIEYALNHNRVWFARRIDIAEHWTKQHPPVPEKLVPSKMAKSTFVETFGGVFEHSSWIADRAFDAELGPAHNTALGLHAALVIQFRLASIEDRLGVLRAHPDLAGKLAAAKRLTSESSTEQAEAGLNSLTDKERTLFVELNESYTKKFGFPFILAVKQLQKKQILETFKERINNDEETEFLQACQQVERISLLRLIDLFN